MLYVDVQVKTPPPSGHERNDYLVPGSKSVNGPTGGQGTVGRQAFSGF